VGDQVTVRETSRERFKNLAELVKDKQSPSWLNLDIQNLTGRVMTEVSREQIDTPLEERLIVEHYSR
jgi:small subunit ribosomal protein S4